MAKKNLFATAKSKAEPKKSSKDEKIRVNIDSYDGDNNDGETFDKLAELAELTEDIKMKEAKAAILSQEIKEIGKHEWVKLVNDKGVNPGSFMLEATKGEDVAQTMFIASDKYISIKTEADADALKDTFGDDIVEEKTEFKFNATMLEKYSAVISDLIANSDEIKEADKEKIIEAVTTWSIAKGTIDKMSKFGDVQTVAEAIRPVISLKGVEVVKS